jgi:hypothetical protein
MEKEIPDNMRREEQPKIAPRRRKRRRPIYISGWNTRALLSCIGVGAAAWGVILGDVWLWRLLYG